MNINGLVMDGVGLAGAVLFLYILAWLFERFIALPALRIYERGKREERDRR